MSDDNPEINQRALQLFLAGATYAQIAAAIDLDQSLVHDIVCRELKSTSERRSVLMGEARSVYQERAEALFKAHWAPALRGDHKSAEICRKLLDRQARLFDAQQPVEDKGNVIDEIASRRAARRARAAARAARTENTS